MDTQKARAEFDKMISSATDPDKIAKLELMKWQEQQGSEPQTKGDDDDFRT